MKTNGREDDELGWGQRGTKTVTGFCREFNNGTLLTC